MIENLKNLNFYRKKFCSILCYVTVFEINVINEVKKILNVFSIK